RADDALHRDGGRRPHPVHLREGGGHHADPRTDRPAGRCERAGGRPGLHLRERTHQRGHADLGHVAGLPRGRQGELRRVAQVRPSAVPASHGAVARRPRGGGGHRPVTAPPTPPFIILRPSGTPPLVFDSPHSGRLYPADFAVKCGRTELRRGEDAYVDELIAGAVRHGAGVLAAVYPRTYIDVNRAETDIDADLLSAPWPGPLAPTEKTERGLGLIRRYVEPGVEVSARLLTPAEVQDRIDRVYRPYHPALAALLEEAGRVQRPVWHVNWHSMKSVGNAMTPDGPGRRRAEFVVSDRDGTTAD